MKGDHTAPGQHPYPAVGGADRRRRTQVANQLPPKTVGAIDKGIGQRACGVSSRPFELAPSESDQSRPRCDARPDLVVVVANEDRGKAVGKGSRGADLSNLTVRELGQATCR